MALVISFLTLHSPIQPNCPPILKDRFREYPLAILSPCRLAAFSYGLCPTQKEKSTVKKLL